MFISVADMAGFPRKFHVVAGLLAIMLLDLSAADRTVFDLRT